MNHKGEVRDCPVGKSGYSSYEEANKIAKIVKARRVKRKYHGAPKVYKCQYCGKWHITGQINKRVKP